VVARDAGWSASPSELSLLARLETGGGVMPQDGRYCPKCGGKLYANHTRTLGSVIHRWVACEACGAGYVTKQDPPIILREVITYDDSSSGKQPLKLGIASP